MQRLDLDLFFNNVTAVGTESLTSAITAMKNMTDLKFSLEFNYIEDRGGVNFNLWFSGYGCWDAI